MVRGAGAEGGFHSPEVSSGDRAESLSSGDLVLVSEVGTIGTILTVLGWIEVLQRVMLCVFCFLYFFFHFMER